MPLRSLRRRLTLTYILIAIPFIAVSGYDLVQRQVAMDQRAAAALAAETEHLGAQLRSDIVRVQQTLATIALLRPVDSQPGCDQRRPQLQGVLVAAGVERLVLADADGAVICAVGEANLGGSVRDWPSFAETRRTREPAVALTRGPRPGGLAMLEAAYPEPAEAAGGAAGVVLATLPAARLAAIAAGWAGPRTASLWLEGGNGEPVRLLAGDAGTGPPANAVPPPAAGVGRSADGGAVSLAVAVADGVALVVRVPSEDVIAATFAHLFAPLVILAGLLLTGIAILLIGITRWVFEPLQALARTISSTPAAVDVEPSLVELPDQIYQLGQSFASRHAEWSRDLQLRELMVAEVNHRIKNSFQMVLSLLRMQERSIGDPKAAAILRVAQERVSTLFVVHRLLERSADGEVADAGELVWAIAETLIPGGDAAGRISFHVDAGPLLLRADQAVVIGLIVNEWITNSLRHGFPGNRTGRIEVHMELAGSEVTLHYADDGIGLRDQRRPGFGTRLITGLVQQLDGSLTALPGPGSRWELRFQLPVAKEPPPLAPAAEPQPRMSNPGS